MNRQFCSIIILFLAMIMPTIGSLMYFVWLPGGGIAQIFYSIVKLFMVVGPVGVYVFLEQKKLTFGPIEWKKHIKALPLGVFTGLIICVAAWILYKTTPVGAYLISFSPIVKAKTADLGIMEHYWAFGVFMSFIHSLLEEYYWRWFVYSRLASRLKPILAHIFAGLAFAGHHYVILGAYFSLSGAFWLGSAVGIGGIIWSWMYSRQKTLMGIWVSHILVDIFILYVGYELIFCCQK